MENVLRVCMWGVRGGRSWRGKMEHKTVQGIAKDLTHQYRQFIILLISYELR